MRKNEKLKQEHLCLKLKTFKERHKDSTLKDRSLAYYEMWREEFVYEWNEYGDTDLLNRQVKENEINLILERYTFIEKLTDEDLKIIRIDDKPKRTFPFIPSQNRNDAEAKKILESLKKTKNLAEKGEHPLYHPNPERADGSTIGSKQLISNVVSKVYVSEQSSEQFPELNHLPRLKDPVEEISRTSLLGKQYLNGNGVSGVYTERDIEFFQSDYLGSLEATTEKEFLALNNAIFKKYVEADPIIIHLEGVGKLLMFPKPLQKIARAHCTGAAIARNKCGIPTWPGEASIDHFRDGNYVVDALIGAVYRRNFKGVFCRLSEQRQYSDSNCKQAFSKTYKSEIIEDKGTKDSTQCDDGECYIGLFDRKLVSLQPTVGGTKQFALSRCIWSACNENTFPFLNIDHQGDKDNNSILNLMNTPKALNIQNWNLIQKKK